PFVLVQSTIAQSGVWIIKHLLENPGRAIVFCLAYEGLQSSVAQAPNVETCDLLDNVPGYSANYVDPRQWIQDAIDGAAATDQFDFVIDSVDTLLSDIGSVAETYKFLHRVLCLIRARPSPSRLILHGVAPCALLPLLTQSTFSSSLTHILAHPPSLLLHLSTEYLTPPPPLSPDAKFWSVFTPISERVYESENIVFGADRDGAGGTGEFVCELVVRVDSGDGLRRKGVERSLIGWSLAGGPCLLSTVHVLKPLWTRTALETPAVDPTQNVSFNLTLTASQQNSRAQVPLPYVHEGKPTIFYDPDSGDDIDDDDPDEDLDI
ncbi:unnamed protein product, partial [Mycena citricolor]